MTGLGGAYGGYAEGVEGTYANAATPAVREPFSLRSIDYDVSASLYAPGFFQTYDVENRPAASRGSASAGVSAGLAGMLQLGRFGVSASTDLQTFTLARPASGDVALRFATARVLAAYGFWKGQISVGVGARGMAVQLAQPGQGTLVFAAGASPEAGVLVRADDQPWRLGVTVRAPVYSTDVGGPGGATAGLVLPRRVVLPAELEAGVAVQIGARPLNPRWIDPSEEEAPLRRDVEAARRDREAARALSLSAAKDRATEEARLDREERALRREEDRRLGDEEERLYEERRARYVNWPRARLLVVAGLVVTAPVGGAVSFVDFLDQENAPYGRSFTASPRFGLEGEPVPDWLVLRVGGYLEPNRFAEGAARQHVTFGADVRLFRLAFFPPLKTTVLRLGTSFDLAPRYANWGLGLGVWH